MSDIRSRSLPPKETSLEIPLTAVQQQQQPEHWDEKRYQSQSTINMLDMLISFVLGTSCLVFIVVLCYLIAITQKGFHLLPNSGEEPELRPEIVAMITMEAVVVGLSCLLFKTRKMPEGKVVVFMIAISVNNLLLGFALNTVFRTILKGVS